MSPLRVQRIILYKNCLLIYNVLLLVKSCKAFEVLALVNGKALTSRKIFFYGDTVEYICNIGYYVTGTTKGSMNTTCNVEGEWTVKPSCEGKYMRQHMMFDALSDKVSQLRCKIGR